jgi:uncharacterized membrane protein YhaH (DUF805 family)
MTNLSQKAFGGNRLNRLRLWLFATTVALLAVLFNSIATLPNWLGWLVACALFGVFLHVCIRRLHDINKSGFLLFIGLLPVVGALWLIWMLGFKRGDSGVNQWGPGVPVKDFHVVP